MENWASIGNEVASRVAVAFFSTAIISLQWLAVSLFVLRFAQVLYFTYFACHRQCARSSRTTRTVYVRLRLVPPEQSDALSMSSTFIDFSNVVMTLLKKTLFRETASERPLQARLNRQAGGESDSSGWTPHPWRWVVQTMKLTNENNPLPYKYTATRLKCVTHEAGKGECSWTTLKPKC